MTRNCGLRTRSRNRKMAVGSSDGIIASLSNWNRLFCCMCERNLWNASPFAKISAFKVGWEDGIRVSLGWRLNPEFVIYNQFPLLILSVLFRLVFHSWINRVWGLEQGMSGVGKVWKRSPILRNPHWEAFGS